MSRAIAISHHPHLLLCTFLCCWYEKYENYISQTPMKLRFWMPESSTCERQWPKIWKVMTIRLLLLVLASKVRWMCTFATGNSIFQRQVASFVGMRTVVAAAQCPPSVRTSAIVLCPWSLWAIGGLPDFHYSSLPSNFISTLSLY